MPTLLLMRHAEANWAEGAMTDAQRTLNARGKAEAEQMGKFLRNEDLSPDLILASTARRSLQTANCVKDEGRFNASIVQNEMLYSTELEAYLYVLEAVHASVRTLLVIGHNPILEMLVSRFAGRQIEMPTAAIARFQLESDDWRSLRQAAACALVALYEPLESD